MYNYFYEKYNSKKIDRIIAHTRDLETLTCSSINSENSDCNEYSFSEEESFSFESWDIKILNTNENLSRKLINFENYNIITI